MNSNDVKASKVRLAALEAANKAEAELASAANGNNEAAFQAAIKAAKKAGVNVSYEW